MSKRTHETLFKLKHYDALMEMVKRLPQGCRVSVAFELCTMLEKDNPNFNRQKFLVCLGGQHDVEIT